MSGNERNQFYDTEDVYGTGRFELYTYSCSGYGESCSGSVDLYVAENKEWTVGESLIDVWYGDGVETILVSGRCDVNLLCQAELPVNKIWDQATLPDIYDFVIDVDKDGQVDQKDPIDNGAITEGFEV